MNNYFSDLPPVHVLPPLEARRAAKARTPSMAIEYTIDGVTPCSKERVEDTRPPWQRTILGLPSFHSEWFYGPSGELRHRGALSHPRARSGAHTTHHKGFRQSFGSFMAGNLIGEPGARVSGFTWIVGGWDGEGVTVLRDGSLVTNSTRLFGNMDIGYKTRIRQRVHLIGRVALFITNSDLQGNFNLHDTLLDENGEPIIDTGLRVDNYNGSLTLEGGGNIIGEAGLQIYLNALKKRNTHSVNEVVS